MRKTQEIMDKMGQVTRVFLVLGLVFLGACTEKPSEAPAPCVQQKPKKASVSVQQAKTESDEKDEYSYDPSGKPDPFQPFVADEELKKAAVSKGHSPLQNLDLGQLTLVGIITGKNPAAMVQDSTGRGYILHLGTRVGSREGSVTSILADQVVITEKARDFIGRIKQQPVTLRMRSSGEGE
ncbi:MAG: pilus assembly protein PilP [Pseudomonadota bacterium]